MEVLLFGRIHRVRWLFALAVLLWGAAPRAGAVIVLGGRDASGDPTQSGSNINPAPDNLGEYVGTFGNYLATPIAPRYFITANHIGNGYLQSDSGGATFLYSNGTGVATTYTATIAGVQNDLAIWEISPSDPSFTLYAPLYTASTEVGNPLVTIGRGTTRGAAVYSPTDSSQQVGWQWGPSNGAITWGTGTVGAITTVTTPGFGGDLLQWSFTNDPTQPDTGILSDGDSGGPVFVYTPADKQYELAGINGLVDVVSQTSDPNGTTPFYAALYDSRGFYTEPPPSSELITGSDPVPLNSYASRISSADSFIQGVTTTPEPASLSALLAGLALVFRRRM